MTEIIQPIPARIKNVAIGGHVAGTEDIIDDNLGKTQQTINQEVDNKVEALTKQDIEVVSTLPAVGDADPKKIYRVSGTTSYTDYMLNPAGTAFSQLATFSFPGIDEVPTKDSNNLVKSGGLYTIFNGEWEYRAASVDLAEDKYYTVVNNTTIGGLTARQGTNCCVLECSPEDVFKLYGKGSIIIRFYAFTDAQNTILLSNTEAVDSRANGLRLTAPEGTKYLYVNFLNYVVSDHIEKGYLIKGLNQKVDYLDGHGLVDSDIVNDFSVGGTNKVLSAEKGKELNIQINGEFSFSPKTLALETDKYYARNGETKMGSIQSREGTNCCLLECSPGDVFKVYGTGTQQIHLYAFTDSDRNILLTNNSTVDTREEGLELIAPANTQYLYINFLNYSIADKLEEGIFVPGIRQKAESAVQLSDIRNDYSGGTDKVLSAEKGKEIDLEINGSYELEDVGDVVEHTYFNMNVSTIKGINSTTSLSWDCATIKVACVAGDRFKVFGNGPTVVVKLYSFTDFRNAVLESAEVPTDSSSDGLDIIAPAESTYLYINLFNYDSTKHKLQKYVIVGTGLEQRVTALENSMGSIASPYRGKKFIAFGDSLTEFSDIYGKRWSDYAEEILDCQIYNVAIGGSHIKGRLKAVLFDESENYAVDDHVFYKPSDTMNLYKCVNAHTGAWNSSDFVDVSDTYISTFGYAPLNVVYMVKAFCNIAESDPLVRYKDQIAAAECIYTHKDTHDDNRDIIQGLTEINYNEVDGIIIFAGTNDYAYPSWRGTSGVADITKSLGCVPIIVENLNTAFKDKPIYYVTPPVRWYEYPGTSGDVSKFSDNWRYGGPTDMSFREWVYALQHEFILNHVPVVNLYDELQWTQWNFSEYFTVDGTHPFKGFKNIAEKISSYLVANKTIH